MSGEWLLTVSMAIAVGVACATAPAKAAYSSPSEDEYFDFPLIPSPPAERPADDILFADPPLAAHGLVQLAQVDCPVNPKKPKGSSQKSTTLPPGCPIDPEKVAGAEEKPTAVQYVYFSQYDFSSPLFWIAQGEFFGRSDFSALHDTAGEYAGGTKVESIDRTALAVRQALRYGITDDINFEALLEEIPSETETIHHLGLGSSTTHSNGWVDPTLFMSYRALYQPRDPFYAYFYAGYVPDLFSFREATPLRAGTVAQGTSQVILESLLGIQTGEFTFQLEATATHSGSRDVNGLHQEGGWSGQIGLEMFDFINDRWSYDVNVVGSRSSLLLEGDLSYFIVPQKLQISGYYEHNFIFDTNGEFGTLRNQQEDVIGVRLGYLFDLASGAR